MSSKLADVLRRPGIDTALREMYPNAKFELVGTNIVDWECEGVPEPPTWDQVVERLQQDIEIHNYYIYARNRILEYGSWQEQFEMLYDDIKSDNLENGEWVKRIDEIKEKYPKPDFEPPSHNC